MQREEAWECDKDDTQQPARAISEACGSATCPTRPALPGKAVSKTHGVLRRDTRRAPRDLTGIRKCFILKTYVNLNGYRVLLSPF